jgi:peptidoglycan/LPS O-acetylase OafA/YrhL
LYTQSEIKLSPAGSKDLKFRTDINGLRAIAVIAVLLFHFNVSWMSGGFAGVDVFFVISGYLMTGIILKGFDSNNFSILKFFAARANRIIPALGFLCIVLLIFGWMFLPPIEYRALGKHVASSISFTSNIIYWRESGYFDANAYQKWLLHTWSVSVEWQFYIIYPIILSLLLKYTSIKSLRRVILASTALGFIFCILATYKWPNPAYYLLPTRAWEMLLGGIAYIYPMTLTLKNKKILAHSGIILVVISYLFISKDNLWPGYLALIPAIGTFLVIQANYSENKITGNQVFQKIGNWSYSIYLWHWPVIVAIHYFQLGLTWYYIGALASIILGYVSYSYIESRRTQSDFSSLKSYLKLTPIYMVLIIGSIGSAIYLTNGAEWHYSQDIRNLSNESRNKNPYECMTENKFPCYIGNINNIKAIIIGDSHADALTTSLASAFDLSKDGIIALTQSSCPFILGMNSIKDENKCLNENNRRLQYLNENHLGIPIFWVARSGAYIYGQTDPERINSKSDVQPSIYFSKIYKTPDIALLNEFSSNLNSTIELLTKKRHVFIVLPTPEMRVNVPKFVSKQILIYKTYPEINLNESIYKSRNSEIIKILSNVAEKNNATILDPAKYLCKEGQCAGLHNGRSIYYDADHMSEYGNKILTPMFLNGLTSSP